MNSKLYLARRVVAGVAAAASLGLLLADWFTPLGHWPAVLSLLVLAVVLPVNDFVATASAKDKESLIAYLRIVQRCAQIFVVVFFSLQFLTEWFFGGISMLTDLGILACYAGILLGGLYFIISGALQARRVELAGRDRIVAALFAPILVGVILTSIPAIRWTAPRAGIAAKLLVLRSSYDRTIAEARQHPRISAGQALMENSPFIPFFIDAGPPVRAAFPGGLGLLDNWSAIVYDPTGDVMLADGWDPKTDEWRAPERITKLFGGDLVYCRPLWADYYHCSFT